MKKFNSSKWIQENKYGKSLSYNDQLLKEYIINFLVDKHFNQELILKEGLGDILSTIKDKLGQKKKAFDTFLAGLNSFRDPQAVIPVLHNLKALDIAPKNEEEAETLRRTIKFHLDGKTAIDINLNEAEDAYSNKVNKAFEENPEEAEHITSWWNDTMAGKTTKVFIILNILFSMFTGSILQTGKDLGVIKGKNIEVTAAIAPGPQMTAYGNDLQKMGFSQTEINNELSSIDGRTLNVKAFGGVGEDTRFFIAPEGNTLDVDTGDQGLEPIQGELATDTKQISDASTQGLRIQLDDKETANFTLFKYGSSELSQEGKNKIGDENEEILKFLLNGQDYSETITGFSSNAGKKPNYDNGKQQEGLDGFRAEEGASFAKIHLETLLDGEGVEYTSTDSTITITETGATYKQEIEKGEGPSKLKPIDKTDETATQSLVRIGKADSKTPPTNTTFFDYDPAAAAGIGGTTGAPPPPPNLDGLIREAQHAYIIALINPDNNLFPVLNKKTFDQESDKPLGGYKQSDFKAVRDDETVPEKFRKIASLCINARNYPNQYLGYMGKILNVKFDTEVFDKRVKIKSVPGDAGQPMTRAGSDKETGPFEETFHPFKDILKEYTQGTLKTEFPDIIKGSDVLNSACDVIAFLGSMYLADKESNLVMNIINYENLPDDIQKCVQGKGFSKVTTGADPSEPGKITYLGPNAAAGGSHEFQTYTADDEPIEPEVDPKVPEEDPEKIDPEKIDRIKQAKEKGAIPSKDLPTEPEIDSGDVDYIDKFFQKPDIQNKLKKIDLRSELEALLLGMIIFVHKDLLENPNRVKEVYRQLWKELDDDEWQQLRMPFQEKNPQVTQVINLKQK